MAETLEYVNRRGTGLLLDIHLPDPGKAPWPVILGVPGGGWRNCSRDAVPRFLVDHGFAMVCIDYRLSGDAIAPANIKDCKAAVGWIHANSQRYGLSPDRLGVYGASAGGHLSALLGVSARIGELEDGDGDLVPFSPAVQAVCAVCGPTDLTRIGVTVIRDEFPTLYEVTEQYLGGPVASRTELARLVSPLTYVSEHCPPILLIHGTADPTVPVEETTIFYEALRNVGADASIKLIEGGGHAWFAEQTEDDIVSFFGDVLGR